MQNGRRIENSGVTIGHGVDLGGRTPAQFRALGLDETIIRQLQPYMGPGGLAHIRGHPSTLDRAQVDQIDHAVEQHELGQLAQAFDRDSRIGSFYDLPANTQTTLTSLFFQYGTANPARAAPQLWDQVTNGRWREALANFRDFHDHYGPRRGLEADRLQDDIDHGRLPERRR